MSSPIEMTSNKPYIVGAFYDWISDNDLTPYIVVDVNVFGVSVPMSYVNDGQIILNISAGAVGAISMGETAIEFSCRFGGKLEHLVVPYGAIAAIYAKENGAGTSLAIEHPPEQEVKPKKVGLSSVKKQDKLDASTGSHDNKMEAKKGRPSLKVIK